MKNIKSIRAAIMLALLSSVFIFAACAKDNGTKLTEKDVVGTWGWIDDMDTTATFYKNNTFIFPGYAEQKKGTQWSIAYELLDDTYSSYFDFNDKEYVITAKYESDITKFVLIKNNEGSYLVGYRDNITGINFDTSLTMKKIK